MVPQQLKSFILNNCNTASLSNGFLVIEELLNILKGCNIAISLLNSSSDIEELLNLLTDCNKGSLWNPSWVIEDLLNILKDCNIASLLDSSSGIEQHLNILKDYWTAVILKDCNSSRLFVEFIIKDWTDPSILKDWTSTSLFNYSSRINLALEEYAVKTVLSVRGEEVHRTVLTAHSGLSQDWRAIFSCSCCPKDG